MKMFFVLLLIGMFSVGCQNKDKALETTSIHAGSMVCGTCARTIEKAVYRVEGVKEVTVDVKTKLVAVKFVPEQTNVQTLERAVTDAGYDANDRKRDDGAYEQLDACCKTEL